MAKVRTDRNGNVMIVGVGRTRTSVRLRDEHREFILDYARRHKVSQVVVTDEIIEVGIKVMKRYEQLEKERGK